MDREKVIVHLNDCMEASRRDNTWVFVRKDIVEDAIALLKEQDEPKQIVRKQCKKEYEDGLIDYFSEWYCPHCKSLIARGFDNRSIKFCYKCGKPILWEGR